MRGKDVTYASASAERTMFTSEASESLRSWIDKISNSDFDDIAFTYTSSDEADCDCDSEYSFESDDLDLSDSNIKELSSEDDCITYKNGNKYIGSIEERKPHGQGQLTLSDGKIIRYPSFIFKIYVTHK